MNTKRLSGLVAATYTPLHENGELRVEQIPPMVEYLLSTGVSGLYVCGSTGEGMSLTSDERRKVANAYVEAASGRVPVIIQVGHNSLAEARQLASHAADIGADMVSATCPSYFKVNSIDGLVDSMSEVAAGAPSLPFYYYHIPVLTGSTLDMVEFLRAGVDRIPNLAGLKYTEPRLDEFQRCVEFEEERFDVVWGVDEMLLGALATGAKAAIGSTYNIFTPLYLAMIEAFERHDFDEAQRLQSLSIDMIRTIGQFPFHPAMKQVLKILGFECGQCRLPQEKISEDQLLSLHGQLQAVGLFDWTSVPVNK